jgi:hypothetical protein
MVVLEAVEEHQHPVLERRARVVVAPLRHAAHVRPDRLVALAAARRILVVQDLHDPAARVHQDRGQHRAVQRVWRRFERVDEMLQAGPGLAYVDRGEVVGQPLDRFVEACEPLGANRSHPIAS